MEQHSRSHHNHHEHLLANPYFEAVSTVGVGTFGTVFLARDLRRGNQLVAVKKVFLDPKFKNRELDIVRQLDHPNCLRHHTHYRTREGAASDVYLHLVTDFLPQTISSFVDRCPRPLFYVRLFGFQLFAGLFYLHSHGVCHRDIKPSNVLIDPSDGRLQICDFGSAKFLLRGEPSVSYIATRSYRAPELLLDCQQYTTAVDVWAAGCVLAEMVLCGAPLFSAHKNEMMYKIARIIGPPEQADLETFPHKRQFVRYDDDALGLRAVLPADVPDAFVDLLEKIFVYAPSKRITAEQCMRHPFFDELFKEDVRMPQSNRPLPEYMKLIRTPELASRNFPKGPAPPTQF